MAGAILVGIYGPSIDSWGGRANVDTTVEAAAAVAGEHASSTADLPSAQRQWVYRTIEEARRQLAPWLGASGRIQDLSELGYEFAGGDTCDVPHCQRGCHIFYYRHRGERPGMVSLHVVPDGPHLDLRTTPELDLPIATELIRESVKCRRDVLLWSHGQRCYLLVVCVPEDALVVARKLQEALRAADSGH